MSAYLTSHEAAVELRCTEKTVRRLIGRGEITAVRVAGRYLISPDALPTAVPARRAPKARPRPPAGHFEAMAREIEEA